MFKEHLFTHLLVLFIHSIAKVTVSLMSDDSTGIAELRIICVLVTSLVLSVPHKAWNEGFIEIATMVGEGHIM